MNTLGTMRVVRSIPTAPDVEKLIQAFKVPTAGTIIKHSEIEAVIGCKWKTGRYYSITQEWREKIQADHNTILGPIPAIGFKSLEPNERGTFVGTSYKKTIRMAHRTHAVASKTDCSAMSPEHRRTVQHVRHVLSAHILADATAAKALPPIK